MTDKTGGAAFPVVYGNANGISYKNEGMSLLDYFAGKALAGLCAEYSSQTTILESAVAPQAYRFAQTMLAERERIMEAQGD